MSLHPRYLLVLDFEATCGDGIRDQEIIELPTFVYDFEEDKVLATFHEYIRPIANPRSAPKQSEEATRDVSEAQVR